MTPSATALWTGGKRSIPKDVKRLWFVRLLKVRLRLAALLHPREMQTTLLWAGLVGLMGGLSSLAFRAAITVIQEWLTGHTEGLVATAAALPFWERLSVPAIGGLLAGMVLALGKRWLGGRRATDFMEAIVLADGVMPIEPIMVRVTASLLTIASGGSIGREGSMVQLAAMWASKLGQLLRLPTPRLRLLVACGVAAGIASAYKAPIAGSLFVAEIVLGSIAMESFGPLVFAAVVATLTVQHFGDRAPVYASGGGFIVSSWEIVPYLILGLLAGAAAPLFLAILRASQTLFDRLPNYFALRLALGGAVVGVISTSLPEVWGNGQSVVNDMLQNDWGALAVGLLLGAKLLATAATVGSGAVGGVFTPTLFMGAAVGLLFEKGYHTLWPQLVFDPRPYALVGMGSFLAATTHAPLMAIIMLFEMTLDYDIVLPLMLACVVAYYTASSIDAASVYTEAMDKRPGRPTTPLPAIRACVADVLKPSPLCIVRSATLVDIAKAFARSQTLHLYVVDADGRLVGAISLVDIQDSFDEPYPSTLVTAFDLMHSTLPSLTPEMGLNQAASAFMGHIGERLPVIADPKSCRLIGSVSKTDLLLTLAHGSIPNAS